MKKFVFLLAFFLISGQAWSATVFLKNGSSVAGKVVERTKDAVKLDVSGVSITYYNDEIDHVDGADADLSAAAPATPPVAATVPATAPETAAVATPPAVNPPPVEAQESVPPKETADNSMPAAVAVAPSVVPAYSPEIARMSKDELILKFVEVFGTKISMQVNFDQMAQSMTPEQANDFKRSFKVDDIIRELLPIYSKHFSEDDLRTYISFYSSPAGQKLVTTIPLIMKESVDVSMKYFEAHMPASMRNASTQK
ncbi:MAG: DUF2059 domain-containing protein [Candidatus Omnitrophica bacterium]|nr:DUF2059 domain-containing protein [Candidatus Omnitrophota bacterium]